MTRCFNNKKEWRTYRIVRLEERYECGLFWVVTDIERAIGRSITMCQSYAFTDLHKASQRQREICADLLDGSYVEVHL